MTATECLRAARILLSQGQPRTALEILASAKRMRRPCRGLDAMRAACFLDLGLPEQAREALLEELRLFPESPEARAAMDALPSDPARQTEHEDEDFADLLRHVRPYTMLPVNRLYNLYLRAVDVCRRDVPGDFAEFGVAGGGSTALLAAVIRRESRRPRTVHAFDTFTGMPDPCEHDTLCDGTCADDTGWGAGTCAAPVDSVLEVCEAVEVLPMVKVHEGLFQSTLPEALDRMDRLALLHGDADWYESMRYILEHCYGRVSPGGVVVLDDYGYWEGCTRAVDEFLDGVTPKPRLVEIDGGGGAWLCRG